MPAIQIIPSDSVSVFQVINNLKTTRPDEAQAIIRPNNPPAGIAGYIFDIVGDESMEINSDITDHYIEDNTSIQDQISLKPEKFTVNGMVAELVMATPTQAIESPPLDPLPLFSDLAPDFTDAAQAIIDEVSDSIDAINSSIVDTQSLHSFFSSKAGAIPQTRQSKVFAYFYQLWRGRQLFSVETPWGIMNDMAIESMTPTQGEASKYRTDFAITFKKMRFAKSVTVNIGQLAGRAVQQNSPTTQQAKATTTTVPDSQKQSLLYQVVH